jgi:hypothetical protein
MVQWASVVIIKAGHFKKIKKIISDNFDYRHPSPAKSETHDDESFPFGGENVF